jgi:hypothetical protein
MNASLAEAPLTAVDVARGVCRLFHHRGAATLAEVPLRCGRRADIVAVDARGEISICEIKVSLADLRGDAKWRDYRAYADRFFWAVPAALAPVLDGEGFDPAASGVIVADRFGAAEVRPALTVALGAARRRVELLRFGRLAASRLQRLGDPFLDELV